MCRRVGWLCWMCRHRMAWLEQAVASSQQQARRPEKKNDPGAASSGSLSFFLAPVVLLTVLADVPDPFILGGAGVALLVEWVLVDEGAPVALPEEANVLGLQAGQFLRQLGPCKVPLAPWARADKHD